MERDPKETLGRLADAISEETPVDWAAEREAHPEIASRIARLRLLEQIAEVHRTSWKSPSESREVLFTWGHLQALEKIGEGGFGAVFRAYDPQLKREVALKLLREELAERTIHARRVLEEARRMARVRHPNVIVIHGADEHDGRVGFWTDLLDGESLEERLGRDGAMGAGETAVIGIEVSRALAAVHGAGLVHGDVKASNIMRDAQGGIVLMDFGAGSESGDAGEALITALGTPLALPPERFRGGAPTPATDIYALGVLLYRLVSGRYPVMAESLGELREMHERGESVPLLDVRPDLPADWVAVVQKALSPDPDERFQTAGEMERALAAALRVTPIPDVVERRRTSWWPFAALAGAAAAIVLFVLLGPLRSTPQQDQILISRPAGQPSGPVAAAPLTARTALYRSRGGARETLSPGALVHPGDALFLELQCAEPSHVYVLNEDEAGEVFVLFPISGLDLQNPLAAKTWHRLPGSHSGTPQDWVVTGGQGRESFLVVASREPLSSLEEVLDRFTPATPGHPISYVSLDPRLLLGSRGVGALQAADPATEEAASPILSALSRRLTESAQDPSGLVIRQFMLYNLGR